jgi:hypothetical protein
MFSGQLPAEQRGRSPAHSPHLGLPAQAHAVAAAARRRIASPSRHTHTSPRLVSNGLLSPSAHVPSSSPAAGKLAPPTQRTAARRSPSPRARQRGLSPRRGFSAALNGTAEHSQPTFTAAVRTLRTPHARHAPQPRQRQRMLTASSRSNPDLLTLHSSPHGTLMPTANSAPLHALDLSASEGAVAAAVSSSSVSSSGADNTDESLASGLFVTAMLTSLRYCVGVQSVSVPGALRLRRPRVQASFTSPNLLRVHFARVAHSPLSSLSSHSLSLSLS